MPATHFRYPPIRFENDRHIHLMPRPSEADSISMSMTKSAMYNHYMDANGLAQRSLTLLPSVTTTSAPESLKTSSITRDPVVNSLASAHITVEHLVQSPPKSKAPDFEVATDSSSESCSPLSAQYGTKRLPTRSASMSSPEALSDSAWREDNEPTDTESNASSIEMLPSATEEAITTYDNIANSIYCGSATGRSIAEESMPCDCKYEPGVDHPNTTCGSDDHCINRMMFMECVVTDCPSGEFCRNRRFQLGQYAKVDVIRTEKKGYGLRALTSLPANAFIMEYMGEVISNAEFIRRTKEYETDGLEHYYFMTLKTDEIIDATKRGCLARFINHSCKPNCVTQKWVTGSKMRIGVFTAREITAGEELTFDYKFERYGSLAQRCYCGEANCKGFIGASSEKLQDTLAAPLPLTSEKEEEEEEEEEMDSGDLAKAVTQAQKHLIRKARRTQGPQPLQDPEKVLPFVKEMLDSVGKPRLVKRSLLRLELTHEGSASGKEVLKQFVRMHGLQMLKFWLGAWKKEDDIVRMILRVFDCLPLVNKNGLEDCNLLATVEQFTDHPDDSIGHFSQRLLCRWSELKSVYRIPKRQCVAKKADTTSMSEKESKANTERSTMPVKARYHCTSEFFEPDDDYFDYVSLSDFVAQNEWTTLISIPTAPLAMLESSTSAVYPSHISTSISDTHDLVDTNALSDSSAVSAAYHPSYYPPLEASYTEDTTTDSSQLTDDGHVLPPQWQSAKSAEGRIYYYHAVTLETQWDPPKEASNTLSSQSSHGWPEQDKKRKRQSMEDSPNDAEENKAGRSPHLLTPSASTSGSVDAPCAAGDTGSDDCGWSEIQLKKEVGKVVTRYLSARQQALWKGDKRLFKELARKITHHIVDRELLSGRKIRSVSSPFRAKVEKLIDQHGTGFVQKIKATATRPA